MEPAITGATVNISHAGSSADALRAAINDNAWREVTTVKGTTVMWYGNPVPAEAKLRRLAAAAERRIAKAVVSGGAAAARRRRRRPRGPFINRFVGMHDASRKCALAYCLSRMTRVFPSDYNFVPRTWCLPSQRSEFGAECRPNRWYIYKPDDGSQGEGIFLLKGSTSHIMSYIDTRGEQLAVVQEYVANPFVLDSFKFDFRVYVVVRRLDPLDVYVCHEGLARFCTMRYARPTPSNMNRSYMHLTNYSLNKHNPEYVRDCIVPSAGTGDSPGAGAGGPPVPNGVAVVSRSRASSGAGGGAVVRRASQQSARVHADGPHRGPRSSALRASRSAIHDDDNGKEDADDGSGDADDDDDNDEEDEEEDENEEDGGEDDDNSDDDDDDDGDSDDKKDGADVEDVDDADRMDEASSKRRLSTVMERLLLEGCDTDVLWAKVQGIVAKTLIAMQPELVTLSRETRGMTDASLRSFQVLGFDVLVDHKFSPWLLEVNNSPSFRMNVEVKGADGTTMTVLSPVDVAVKRSVLRDGFKIVASRGRVVPDTFERVIGNDGGSDTDEDTTDCAEDSDDDEEEDDEDGDDVEPGLHSSSVDVAREGEGSQSSGDTSDDGDDSDKEDESGDAVDAKVVKAGSGRGRSTKRVLRQGGRDVGRGSGRGARSGGGRAVVSHIPGDSARSRSQCSSSSSGHGVRRATDPEPALARRTSGARAAVRGRGGAVAATRTKAGNGAGGGSDERASRSRVSTPEPDLSDSSTSTDDCSSTSSSSDEDGGTSYRRLMVFNRASKLFLRVVGRSKLLSANRFAQFGRRAGVAGPGMPVPTADLDLLFIECTFNNPFERKLMGMPEFCEALVGLARRVLPSLRLGNAVFELIRRAEAAIRAARKAERAARALAATHLSRPRHGSVRAASLCGSSGGNMK